MRRTLDYEDKSSFDGVIFRLQWHDANTWLGKPQKSDRRVILGFSPLVATLFLQLTTEPCPSGKSFGHYGEEKVECHGKQDPGLQEFGDRFEETPKGKLFIHVPDVSELRSDLQTEGFVVERDVLRSKLAEEEPLTLKYSDECRFWICRKPA